MHNPGVRFRGFAGSWEDTDHPETVHAEIFPDCPLVRGTGCGNQQMPEQRRQEVAAQLSAASGKVLLVALGRERRGDGEVTKSLFAFESRNRRTECTHL